MARHKVPTHLDQPDGIGKFSYRQIVLIGAAVIYILPEVWNIMPKDGPALGDALRRSYPGLAWMFPPGSLPVVPILGVLIVFAPFVLGALPIEPPVEHGFLACVRWALFTRGNRKPAKVAVDFGELVVKEDRVESNYGFHAVWELPTVNLRLADQAETEMAEDQWGEFLTGLTSPVQSIVRARRVDPEHIVSRIESYIPSGRGHAAGDKTLEGSTPGGNAKRVGAALRQLVKQHALLERRHLLAIWAPDREAFDDTVDEIVDGFTDLGLQTGMIRRLEGETLMQAVQSTWSQLAPLGPRLGPVERVFNARGAWFADGEWHIVVAYGRWPRIAIDNALAPLADGSYEVDVILHKAPVEADEILGGLERRSEALKITDQMGRFRKRYLAIEDLDDFIIKLESGEESAFDVAILLHVHGPTRKEVEQNAKRVIKRVRRSGGHAVRMPWEQADAMLGVAPLALMRMARRTRRVTTSPLKNFYPLIASSMWMENAIPLGETLESKRPVGLNAWLQPIIPNPHMVVYALSGAGKGFFIKVFCSRELFARMVQEVFCFDRAEEDPVNGEYGKWAAYCGLEYRHVTAADASSDFRAVFADLDKRWLGPGIVWNIAQLPLGERPRFLAMFKDLLWKRARDHPANRSWVVDELWSFVKMSEEMGADPHWLAMSLAAIEDLIRTGRHMHVSGRMLTQRAKDSLDVPVMQVLQDQAGIQCYGMQNPSHISDIADRLHWTPAEVRVIKKLTSGQWVMRAGPWHVAAQVMYADDAEYEMAQTDNVIELAA